MSGFFIPGERKDRPGVYKRYENAGLPVIAGAREGIACAVVTGNWGPLNAATHIEVGEDIAALVGSGSGADVINEIFAGGVNECVIVRAGTGGTKAAITLKDTTSGTAIDVVTLTAKYPGTRPLSVSVKTSLDDNTVKQAVIYEGTKELEGVTFTAGSAEVDGIVAAFKDSKYVTATKLAAGNGTLANVAQGTLTGGADPTVNTTAYSDGFGATENETWDMIVVDTNDTAVHALLLTFIQRMYQEGAYPMAVVGEASSVALATRMQHAAAYNDEKFHYVLNSWENVSGTVYEGYLAAARIAGMICATPASQSLTHTTITSAAKLNEALTNAEIKKALRSGCIVLSLNKSKQVWIEKAINTLITLSATQDAGWKKIRRVKERLEVMYRIEETLETMIGKIDNDPDGRAAVIAASQRVIDAMVGEKKLLSGSVFEDENNPAEGDSAWFIVAIDDLDSLENIYLTFRFRFAPDNTEE